jgi:hypothetical protein
MLPHSFHWRSLRDRNPDLAWWKADMEDPTYIPYNPTISNIYIPYISNKYRLKI